MKIIHYIGFILFFSISLVGCQKKSDKVELDRIYADLSINYSEVTDASSAYARFYLDDEEGKRLNLDSESAVFYENIKLTPTFNGSNIYRTYLTGYIDSSEIVWNDGRGDVFSNSAVIPAPIYALDQSFGTHFNPYQGYDFYWEGDSVGLDEIVTVSWRVDDPDTSFTLTATQLEAGLKFAHFSRHAAEMMTWRRAYVTIHRQRRRPLTEGTPAGGVIRATYTSGGSALFGY